MKLEVRSHEVWISKLEVLKLEERSHEVSPGVTRFLLDR